MIEREEKLDERIYHVFGLVGLLVISIKVMMTTRQLDTPVPALGMRTTKELFSG